MKKLKPIKYTLGQTKRPSTTMKREQAGKMKEPEEEMGLIQGQEPGSKYEWYIARALNKYGWRFEYQVPISGGRKLRGGQVLDFLVHTVPMHTPLAVQGSYWHRDSELEQLKAEDIQQHVGYPVNAVLYAYDQDADTFEAACRFIFKNFGRG